MKFNPDVSIGRDLMDAICLGLAHRSGRRVAKVGFHCGIFIADGSAAGLGALLAILTIFGWIRQQRRSNHELMTVNQQLVRTLADLEAGETKIRQMQKMEAIGQLTGGIAHDFNNLLAVIVGSLNLLQKRIRRGDTDVQKFVDAALEGADRAATLTKRLLNFSRQYPLAPEPIKANALVSNMSELVARTMGDVKTETILAGGLWWIHVDKSLLESSILNLCINARDAMPDGGKLTIETANTHLDEAYCREHPEVTVGQYVLIAVTDTGRNDLDSAAGTRSFLHDQGSRQGHRARPLASARFRQAIGRTHQGLHRARRRYDHQAVLSAIFPAGRRAAAREHKVKRPTIDGKPRPGGVGGGGR
jgi:signal transduction histidine kinase